MFFGLLVSPVTILFSGTPMRDNIEDLYVTRSKRGDFVTKSSLNFTTNVQYVEIVSIDAQMEQLPKRRMLCPSQKQIR